MSMFGVPPEISTLQAVQAQREAAKARDRSRAAIEKRPSVREEEERFRVEDTAEISEPRQLDEEANTDDERSRHRRDEDQQQAAAERRLEEDSRVAKGHIDLTA